MAIQKISADVYYAPTKNRRYFSRQAAIKGEATAIILKKYPSENSENDESGRCTHRGWDIRVDEPGRFERLHRGLCFILKKVEPIVPPTPAINNIVVSPMILQSNVESSIEALITDRKVKYISDTHEFVEGLKIGLEIAGLYGDDIKELYSKHSTTG